MLRTTTCTSGRTVYVFQVPWKGQAVFLTWDSDGPIERCPDLEHKVEVMHHYGDEGKHYCPTGFLQCDQCGAMGYEPDPPECTRWGW